MPRPAEVLYDRTDPGGPRVDLPARIGWLLRVTRQAAGVSLNDLAGELRALGRPMSTPVLSRLERAGGRNGAVVDAYEMALRLRPGQLRATVDLMVRPFAYRPADEDPRLPGPATLARFDRAVQPILAGGGTGVQWLTFAREHDEAEPFGLPSDVIRPHVARLASELGRSVDTAYATRFEALARLRCGAYGELVADVVEEVVADPATQVLADLMTVLAEGPTPRLLTWSAELLADDCPLRRLGASVALEISASVGGVPREVWAGLVPAYLRAVEAAAGDSERRAGLARLLQALPTPLRTGVRDQLDLMPPRLQCPRSWAASRSNEHWAYADTLALEAARRLGLPDQPMLTRLLFEILFDFRWARRGTSGFVISTSPFGPVVRDVLFEALGRAPDECTRQGVLQALFHLPMAWEERAVGPWLEAGDPALARSALTMAARAGVELPRPVLERCLADPALASRALYAAGMAGHPILHGLAADGPHRAGARWWLRQGARIVE